MSPSISEPSWQSLQTVQLRACLLEMLPASDHVRKAFPPQTPVSVLLVSLTLPIEILTLQELSQMLPPGNHS